MKQKKTKEKMKEIFEEIEIPSGINAVIEDEALVFQKGNEKVSRKLAPEITITIEGNKLVIKSDKASKRERRTLGTMRAHINNIFKGLNEKFKYKLQIANVHFPITVKIDNGQFIIKNFLGEKKDRIIKLVPGVEVKINKDIIELESADIEKAGLVASNLEKGTKIRNRDRRVFQDGIFIIEKPGRSFL